MSIEEEDTPWWETAIAVILLLSVVVGTAVSVIRL